MHEHLNIKIGKFFTNTLVQVVIYIFTHFKKEQLTLLCLTDGSGSVGGYFDNYTLERWIKQIKQDLLIDKRSTNAYLRTLSSVNDPRPASIAIGGSGVALLCFAILIIVLSDVLTFCKYVFGKDSKAIISKPC